MINIFSSSELFEVPNGTLVSPFLNAKDSKSGLPFDLLDGFSLAQGAILPHSNSKIHIMPHVTKVTHVLEGDLNVMMKEPMGGSAHECACKVGEAVLTKPGTFFQLINGTETPCKVLHIISPTYFFEFSEPDGTVYDDSLVLDEDWDEHPEHQILYVVGGKGRIRNSDNLVLEE